MLLGTHLHVSPYQEQIFFQQEQFSPGLLLPPSPLCSHAAARGSSWLSQVQGAQGSALDSGEPGESSQPCRAQNHSPVWQCWIGVMPCAHV